MGALLPLIGILAQIADSILSYAVKNKLPQEIIDAAVAATTAIATLHNTAVTKAPVSPAPWCSPASTTAPSPAA